MRLGGIGSSENDADRAVDWRAAQELVETIEIRERDVYARCVGRMGRRHCAFAFRGIDRGERSGPPDHGLGTVKAIALAGFDCLSDPGHRVLAQELQDLRE
jgi:hypothetical protein